jgi:hypothetical protein
MWIFPYPFYFLEYEWQVSRIIHCHFPPLEVVVLVSLRAEACGKERGVAAMPPTYLSQKQNTYFEARKLNAAHESTVATKLVQK